MTEAHVEVELKYSASNQSLTILATADQLGAAHLGATVVNHETDVYLDTGDLRLASAGWACRLRTRRVDGTPRTFVSLKGPPEAAAGALHRRPELEGPANDDLDPGAWPPSAARDRLDALRNGAALAPRLALEQRRRERPVSLGSTTVGTLSLDDVTVVHLGAAAGRFLAVELELLAGTDPAPLTALARELAGVPGLVPDRATKLERALQMVEDPQGAGP